MTATRSGYGLTPQTADVEWRALAADPTSPDALGIVAELLTVTRHVTVEQAELAWRIALPWLRPGRAVMESLDIADDLAALPDLPFPLLTDLARRGPSSMLPQLAARNDLPRRTFMDLWRRIRGDRLRREAGQPLARYRETLVALADNPAFPTDRLYLLADLTAPQIRAAVAARRDLPAGTARRLLADASYHYDTVLDALASNPAVPDQLRVLAALSRAATNPEPR